ncbi:MAG: hypothetical protein JXA33_15470 [Anaerolineae bacterium]|nr:hypothetical protein [Anaerolineae bacterium]
MRQNWVVKGILIWVLGLVCLSLNPCAVRADAGPKPSMEFNIVYETDTVLTIVEGIQFECSDATCADAEALKEAGPQRFTCEAATCSSLAYGYADYHRLSIRFSDGVTRESNVFSKSHFDAVYRVTVRETDLWVEETGGRINPMLLIIVGGVVGSLIVGLLVVATIVLLVMLFLKSRKDAASFEASRWLFIVIWIVALPLYAMGGYFALTLPITAAVECIIAFIYAHIRDRSRWTLVTVVLLINLLTQPIVWGSVTNRADGGSFAGLAILEIIIILIEAGVLYGVQRKSLTFKETLILSLILNGASFGIGLLLPI